jgi:ribonuclease BN (tRNA processing enzyme)
VANRTILIDCGPATTHKIAQIGRSPAEVSALLFTHHQFDHNADYPCFVLNRWDQDIEQTPLRVFGPRPTAAITEKLFAAPDGAYVCDWNARVEHPGSQRVFANRGGKARRTAPKIDSADVDANFVWEEKGLLVRAAETMHVQPYLDSLAFRIETEQECIVFTGDTELVDSVRQLARRADMLISMCWDTGADAEAAGEDRGMLNTTTAGVLAMAAGVPTLVLTHLTPHLDTPEGRRQGLREIESVFDGVVLFAEELQPLDVRRPVVLG